MGCAFLHMQVCHMPPLLEVLPEAHCRLSFQRDFRYLLVGEDSQAIVVEVGD
jgi:hypothetical protein